LTADERDELRGLYHKLREQELPHDQAIRLTLARVLVAPAFLYRVEKPGPGDKPGPVNDWELATRLSYFLWSSAPDAELRAVAANGKLRDPDVLAAQARRMLRDSRVRRLATEFACQWLNLYDFDHLDDCDDPFCDARICRAWRGLPPLTKAEIDADRKEAQEAKRQQRERVRKSITRKSKRSA
jgi:hypothetical protein